MPGFTRDREPKPTPCRKRMRRAKCGVGWERKVRGQAAFVHRAPGRSGQIGPFCVQPSLFGSRPEPGHHPDPGNGPK